jgi:hypothetical protein
MQLCTYESCQPANLAGPAAAAASAEDAEVVIELMPSMSCGYYHKGFALHQLHDYAGAVSRQTHRA